MGKRNSLIICLVMAVTAFFWGVDARLAPAEETNQRSAITGPFRDPESVPKLRSTTNAQREEAARRAAEYRAEVAKKGMLKDTSGAAPPDSKVPPKAKGGKNE